MINEIKNVAYQHCVNGCSKYIEEEQTESRR